MDQPDIRTLTDLAESGQGCALRDQLSKLTFEQSMKALKDIAAMNAKDRDKIQGAVPEKLEYYSTNSDRDYAFGSLYKSRPHEAWGVEIFKDMLGMNDSDGFKIGERKNFCFEPNPKR